MNPFAAHADNMREYEAMCAEPIEGREGNSVRYANSDFPAVVGVFTLQQVLESGGFVPKLMAQVIIQKNVLPESVVFKTGHFITARQIGGAVRECQIYTIEDAFTEWRLQLWDKNQ